MCYRTYRRVRYRCWCRTELTEVSGTGIDVVLNLPKCPVPVTTFIFWWGRKNKSPFCLCRLKQASCQKSDAEMVLGPFVCLLVWFFSSSFRSLDIENSSRRRLLLCLAPRRVHFARSWTQASKPALTDSNLATTKRAAALRLVFLSNKHPSPPGWPTYCCCWCVCTLVWDVATKDARWVRCSSWSLGPRPRPPSAIVWLWRGAATAFAHRGCIRSTAQNQRGHWVCWISTSRQNGLMWRTYTHRSLLVHLCVPRTAAVPGSPQYLSYVLTW